MSNAAPEHPTTLRLEPSTRDVLTAELVALLERLGDPSQRERYAALLAAVHTGAVPSHLAHELGTFLELGLETGRFRARYGGYAAEALVRLYHRAPQGASVVESARAISQALDALAGQTIEAVRVTPSAPGSYTLLLDTDRAHVVIRLTRAGARVDTVEVAG